MIQKAKLKLISQKTKKLDIKSIGPTIQRQSTREQTGKQSVRFPSRAHIPIPSKPFLKLSKKVDQWCMVSVCQSVFFFLSFFLINAVRSLNILQVLRNFYVLFNFIAVCFQGKIIVIVLIVHVQKQCKEISNTLRSGVVFRLSTF